MDITEKATQDYGSQWNIPDSEGFEEVQTVLEGRKRAETGLSVTFLIVMTLRKVD